MLLCSTVLLPESVNPAHRSKYPELLRRTWRDAAHVHSFPLARKEAPQVRLYSASPAGKDEWEGDGGSVHGTALGAGWRLCVCPSLYSCVSRGRVSSTAPSSAMPVNQAKLQKLQRESEKVRVGGKVGMFLLSDGGWLHLSLPASARAPRGERGRWCTRPPLMTRSSR